MIRSMTGYGRTETVVEGKPLAIEIKSLNHRNLEVFVRIPSLFSFLEVDIKKRISGRISRGRVEIGIRIDGEGDVTGSEQLRINLPLICNYHALLNQVREELGLEDSVTLDMIAGLKNGIYLADADIDSQKAWTSIANALDEAMDSLIVMKEREGELLYEDFVERLRVMGRGVEKLESIAPQVVEEYKKKLSERIVELTEGLEIDEARLTQEIAIMTVKSDINEELVRLRSHMNQFKEMLDEKESTGRKLDFLLQEMHREINTIGSKSSDLEISRNVIEIKNEIAKLKEQVQNIE